MSAFVSLWYGIGANLKKSRQHLTIQCVQKKLIVPVTAMCTHVFFYHRPDTTKPKGLTSYIHLVYMRAKIEGFIVYDFTPLLLSIENITNGSPVASYRWDYQSQYAAAEKEMAQWILDGRLKRKYHVIEGLANAPGMRRRR